MICQSTTTKSHTIIRSLLRAVALPLIPGIRGTEALQRAIRRARLELWHVEGTERFSKLPISILCAASNQTKHLIIRSVFGDSFRERSLGRVWIWNLTKAIKASGQGCSLVVADVHRTYRRLLPISHCFFIPGWVDGEVEIPLDPAVMRKDSVKADLRKIRKSNLTFRVTHESQCFEEFYHNMYVPFTTQAHQSLAYVKSYDVLRESIRDCDLLLISNQSEAIAGMVIQYVNGCPRLWWLGIRDANADFVSEGALSALYYYSFEHLVAKGYTRVGLGLSRPFLRDGVLQYKRKLAQRIIGGTSSNIALKILSCTAAANAFLQNNPFIFEGDSGLSGAVFVDSESAPGTEELERIKKEHCHPGMSRLCVYNLRGKSGPQPVVVPSEFTESIVLNPSDS